MSTRIEIKSAGGGASISTATLMRTGATTSYRTGDDADTSSEGRATDFFTLAENNPFGNLLRFTDQLGTQTYADDIVIDWSTYDGSTVLGWRRTLSVGNTNWDASIDAALLVSVGTFTSGWRLPNYIEMLSICNLSITTLLNYSPFNLSSGSIWSSTTSAASTGGAWCFSLGSYNIFVFNKLNGGRILPCRTFTVTGTTLT